MTLPISMRRVATTTGRVVPHWRLASSALAAVCCTDTSAMATSTITVSQRARGW
ncbi:MAG TPA: hypothetical protein VGZ52_08010 [Acidimicrobiales bacterium]|nr:hypothetical protein [Acidimicrobiales bacterium]